MKRGGCTQVTDPIREVRAWNYIDSKSFIVAEYAFAEFRFSSRIEFHLITPCQR